MSEERIVWIHRLGLDAVEYRRVVTFTQHDDGSLTLVYKGTPDEDDNSYTPATWFPGKWFRWEDNLGNSGTSPRVDTD